MSAAEHRARADHHRAGARKARSAKEQAAYAQAQLRWLNAGRGIPAAARPPSAPVAQRKRPRLHTVAR